MMTSHIRERRVVRRYRLLGASATGVLAVLVGLLLFAILLVMMMGWYITAFENHLAMWRG